MFCVKRVFTGFFVTSSLSPSLPLFSARNAFCWLQKIIRILFIFFFALFRTICGTSTFPNNTISHFPFSHSLSSIIQYTAYRKWQRTMELLIHPCIYTFGSQPMRFLHTLPIWFTIMRLGLRLHKYVLSLTLVQNVACVTDWTDKHIVLPCLCAWKWNEWQTKGGILHPSSMRAHIGFSDEIGNGMESLRLRI